MTVISVIGTGVGTLLAQIYREGRRHKWDEETRARIASELAAKMHAEAEATRLASEESRAALARSVAESQARIAEVMEHERRNRLAAAAGNARAMVASLEAIQGVKDDIQANTALTLDAASKASAAYHEANSVNDKIRGLTEIAAAALLKPNPEPPA